MDLRDLYTIDRQTKVFLIGRSESGKTTVCDYLVKKGIPKEHVYDHYHSFPIQALNHLLSVDTSIVLVGEDLDYRDEELVNKFDYVIITGYPSEELQSTFGLSKEIVHSKQENPYSTIWIRKDSEPVLFGAVDNDL